MLHLAGVSVIVSSEFVAVQLVSVIITAYNYARYLPDALQSCRAQTYRPIEIIVVDAGSTDNTREVVAGFPEVKYIYQDNQGPAAGRNTGLRYAQGEFIQLLDADDTISPTKIARCVQAYREHPEAGLVYTDFVICHPDMQPWAGRQRRWSMPQGNNVLPLIIQRINPFFANHCALIRRQSIAAVGGFNEKLKNGEDWFLWVRMAANGVNFYFIDEPLAQYRMTPNSFSKNRLQAAYNKLLAREELRAIPEIAAAVNLDQAIGVQHVNLAMLHWQYGSRVKARHHLRSAIQIQNANRRRRHLLILGTYFLPASVALWGQRTLYKIRKVFAHRLARSLVI